MRQVFNSNCICPGFPAVPLQLLHVRAVFRENPDPSAVRRPSVQVKSQVIHLLCLAAGEAGDLAGSWDRSQVVDPQKGSGLTGQIIRRKTVKETVIKDGKLLLKYKNQQVFSAVHV